MRRGAHNAWAIYLLRRQLEAMCLQLGLEPAPEPARPASRKRKYSSFVASVKTESVAEGSLPQEGEQEGYDLDGQPLLPAFASAEVVAEASLCWNRELGTAGNEEDDEQHQQQKQSRRPVKAKQRRWQRRGGGHSDGDAGSEASPGPACALDPDVFRRLEPEQVEEVFPGLTSSLVNKLPERVKQVGD